MAGTATRIAENWRRDIGEMLRCMQYGNGFSISHLRVVTCDRRLKCNRYISRWDLQGTRPDLPHFLVTTMVKCMCGECCSCQRLEEIIFICVLAHDILILILKFISQILSCTSNDRIL